MRARNMMERVTEATLRTGEPLSNLPLLELYGERRVLIEHHKGIGEYSCGVIEVKVNFGAIRICGSNLEICRMTADQLIIMGNIDSITLFKGCGR